MWHFSFLRVYCAKLSLLHGFSLLFPSFSKMKQITWKGRLMLRETKKTLLEQHGQYPMLVLNSQLRKDGKYCFCLIWSIDQMTQTLTFWKPFSFLICMGKTCPQKPPKTPEEAPCDLAVRIFLNYVDMLSRFSHVWLFATPWTVAHQAPLSLE